MFSLLFVKDARAMQFVYDKPRCQFHTLCLRRVGAGIACWFSVGLVIERLRVRMPAGAAVVGWGLGGGRFLLQS